MEYGGKFEDGETPEECLVREVKEETGLILKKYDLKGIITYVSTEFETEHMYLFKADDFEGDLIECSEGELEWIEKEEVPNLKTWEGDNLFLNKLDDSNFFTMKLEYNGDKLINYKITEY